jgi:hypothetical protein
MWICLIVHIFALLGHVLCTLGLSGLMRLLREVSFVNYVKVFYICCSFSLIFAGLICPSGKAQALVTHVFQVSCFSCSFHFTFSIVKDEYSPSHLPKSFFILECLTGVFAVQHLIVLVVLRRCKPPNFDFFKNDRVETMEKSRRAPPPYEEIGKATLSLPASSPIQVAVQGEANVPI